MQWLRQPDDGFAQLLRYMAAHVPAGTWVDADDSQYALDGMYHVVTEETPAALSQEHVRYVVVEGALIDEGYSDRTPSQVRHLIGHGRLVFSFSERTFGQIALYELAPPSGPARAVHRVDREVRGEGAVTVAPAQHVPRDVRLWIVAAQTSGEPLRQHRVAFR